VSGALAVTCNVRRQERGSDLARWAIAIGQVRRILPGDGRPRPRQPAGGAHQLRHVVIAQRMHPPAEVDEQPDPPPHSAWGVAPRTPHAAA